MKLINVSKVALVALLLLNVGQAQADTCSLRPFSWFFKKPVATESTFGPEFTFTNSTLVNEGNKALSEALAKGRNPFYALKTKFNMEKYEAFKDILIKRCKVRQDCTTSIGSDKHGENVRVTYKDGFYFEVGIDMCVIETQTKPGRIADFVFNKKRLETDLWKVAESLDLRPHNRTGQGHVHIGLSAFNHDPLLLRNFFVDYTNHPELAYGALGNHLLNSPPVAALKPEQRTGLKLALEKFDSLSKKTIPEFVRLIHKYTYTSSTASGWGGADYYHAIRLQRSESINEASTVEIRAFRPQATVDEFVLQLELIQGRIDFLKGKRPVEYQDTGKYEYSPQEVVNGFHKYITEANLSWEKFKVLLPANLRSIAVNSDPISR